MYDIDFYGLLTEAEDRVLIRNRDLENIKKELRAVDVDESFPEELKIELRDLASELYLSIQYAQTLRAELELMLPKVRLLSAFAEGRFDDETFNMLYEEGMGDE